MRFFILEWSTGRIHHARSSQASSISTHQSCLSTITEITDHYAASEIIAVLTYAYEPGLFIHHVYKRSHRTKNNSSDLSIPKFAQLPSEYCSGHLPQWGRSCSMKSSNTELSAVP